MLSRNVPTEIQTNCTLLTKLTDKSHIFLNKKEKLNLKLNLNRKLSFRRVTAADAISKNVEINFI